MSVAISAFERRVPCDGLLLSIAKYKRGGSSHCINLFVANVFVSNIGLRWLASVLDGGKRKTAFKFHEAQLKFRAKLPGYLRGYNILVSNLRLKHSEKHKRSELQNTQKFQKGPFLLLGNLKTPFKF